MIYFDDVFYSLYKNTGKEFQLVDRQGNVSAYTLIENDEGRSYAPVNDGILIQTDYVKWTAVELAKSDYATHYVATKCITDVKERALLLDIKAELTNVIPAFTRYFDYYKDPMSVFKVYALANYDTRQDGRASIVARFDQKFDELASAKQHKLIGVAPSISGHDNAVYTVTNEAWRFELLPWSKIREICPEFVQLVLNGQEP